MLLPQLLIIFILPNSKVISLSSPCLTNFSFLKHSFLFLSTTPHSPVCPEIWSWSPLPYFCINSKNEIMVSPFKTVPSCSSPSQCPIRCPVNQSKNRNAILHAFLLEKVRHALNTYIPLMSFISSTSTL